MTKNDWPVTRPAYIRLVENIFTMGAHFQDWHGQLPALFEGYLLITEPSDLTQDQLERTVLNAVFNGKTLLLEKLEEPQRTRLLHLLRRCRRGRLFVDRAGPPHCVDLLDSDQLEALGALAFSRALLLPHIGLRRYRQLLADSQTRAFSLDPRCRTRSQHIHVIGLEPSRAMIHDSTLRALHQSSTIVSFAFVMDMLADQHLDAQIELVPYDWQTYANNIASVHRHLIHLQAKGVDSLTLLVEGNPEVYDLLPYLIHPGRSFSYTGVLPSAIICANHIGQRVGLALTEPGYAVLSCYSARHHSSIATLSHELRGYMDSPLHSFIIELYSGDFPLILRCIQDATRPKCLLVMSDIFTERERVIALASDELTYLSWLDKSKGYFTSLAVLDENTLRDDAEHYQSLLDRFSPYRKQRDHP